MGRMRLLDNVINAATNQVEGFCIVKSAQIKSNIKGNDYLDLVLADAGGEINAKLWDYDMSVHGMFYPDTIIKVRGTVTQWKEVDQLKVDRIRKINEGEDIDMSSLVPCAPFTPSSMYDTIFNYTEEFKNSDIKLLTQYILKSNKEQLLLYPAALKLHHAMRGGLLFHTVTMLKAADGFCKLYKELYPALSTDLVFSGIILHDIAKLQELTVGELGLATAYSVKGQLLGHINIGVAMLEQAAAELMTDEKITTLLQHILLSHHGSPEFGSPRSPMFPEAEIVSTVDLLDARMFEMFDALDNTSEGDFTERLWALENRQLYRHGLE